MIRPPYRDAQDPTDARPPSAEGHSIVTDWLVVGVILTTVAYLTDWPRLVNATAHCLLGF